MLYLVFGFLFIYTLAIFPFFVVNHFLSIWLYPGAIMERGWVHFSQNFWCWYINPFLSVSSVEVISWINHYQILLAIFVHLGLHLVLIASLLKILSPPPIKFIGLRCACIAETISTLSLIISKIGAISSFFECTYFLSYLLVYFHLSYSHCVILSLTVYHFNPWRIAGFPSLIDFNFNFIAFWLILCLETHFIPNSLLRSGGLTSLDCRESLVNSYRLTLGRDMIPGWGVV